jgi:hypothetical protein
MPQISSVAIACSPRDLVSRQESKTQAAQIPLGTLFDTFRRAADAGEVVLSHQFSAPMRRLM